MSRSLPSMPEVAAPAPRWVGDHRLTRRTLLINAGIAALAPRIVLAQTPGRVYRVAFVGYALPTLDVLYRERLAQHGFVEGSNLELRHFGLSNGAAESLAAVTREALSWNPDVLRVFGTRNTRAVAAVTSAVPIVFDSVADPVQSGLVASLARPGGNITGVALSSPELISKRLELVRQLLPRAKRVALIIDSSMRAMSAATMTQISSDARMLGLALEIFDPSREPGNFVGALQSAVAARPDALIPALYVVDSRDTAALRLPDSSRGFVIGKVAADIQRKHRIPVIWNIVDAIEFGLLAALGNTWAELAQIVADQTARILRGARASETPVQQFARIEVGINLATAKELGIEVPQSVLVRADKVVQ